MTVHTRRITKDTGDSFCIEFEGKPIEARPGESVAAALIASGHYNLRSAEDNSARGPMCGIGVCWECRCIIDQQPNRRACMIEVRPGMVVCRQFGVNLLPADLR